MQHPTALWVLLLHLLGLHLMGWGAEGLHRVPRQLTPPIKAPSSPAGSRSLSVGVISNRIYWWIGYRSKYRAFGTSYRWFYVGSTPYYYVGPGPTDKVGYSEYKAPFNPWWPALHMLIVVNVELSVLCCFCAFRT